MQKIVGLIFFLMFGLFYSCTENANDTVNKMETEAKKEARQVFFMMGATPDSLRSPEQKALFSMMEMMFCEHCVIKDKQLELTISKKELKAMGVPQIYYDLVKEDLEDLNRCLDGTRIIPYFTPDSIIDGFKQLQDEYLAAKGLKRLE